MIAALGLGAAFTLASCAPGGSVATSTSKRPSDVQTDPSKAGEITLTVWDGESAKGISTSLDTLNKRFQAKYPNVTIKRVTRTLADTKATLKLAMSGDNPPDVAEINQGYSDMASYVKAGLLTDFATYAEVYGWRKRFPASQLALNSVSRDGTKLGTGDLYGVSLTGEIVGVFRNEKLLQRLGIPAATSMEELDGQLAALKRAGITPVAFGNQDAWPAIHLLGADLTARNGAEKTAELVLGRSGSWTASDVVGSAGTVQRWAKDGYLSDGFSGQTMDAAVEDFAKGNAAYLIGGVWNQAVIAGLDGARFSVLPATSSSKLAALGGIGYAWGIPAKAKNADVAAAYIDFITGPEGMETLAKNQQLPSVPPSGATGSGQLADDILTEWKAINAADGLVPYLDWTTPTFYDTITQQLQLLLADKEQASAFGGALQKDAAAFDGK